MLPDSLDPDAEARLLSLVRDLDPTILFGDFDHEHYDETDTYDELFLEDLLFVRSANDSFFDEECSKWEFYNSVFFSFTAVTTIGKTKKSLKSSKNCTFPNLSKCH